MASPPAQFPITETWELSLLETPCPSPLVSSLSADLITPMCVSNPLTPPHLLLPPPAKLPAFFLNSLLTSILKFPHIGVWMDSSKLTHFKSSFYFKTFLMKSKLLGPTWAWPSFPASCHNPLPGRMDLWFLLWDLTDFFFITKYPGYILFVIAPHPFPFCNILSIAFWNLSQDCILLTEERFFCDPNRKAVAQ